MAEVRLLAGLRETLGGGQRRLQVGAANVEALLQALVAGSPDAALAAEAVFPGDALHEDLHVLVNGRNIDFLAGLETPLTADDAVTLHYVGARGYPGG